MVYDVTIDGTKYRLELEHPEGGWQCRVNGRDVPVDAILARRDVLSVIVNGQAFEIKRERTANDLHLWIGSARYSVEVRDPRSLRSRATVEDEKGPRKLTAPMPGRVVRILVEQGAELEAGQGVVVVEAMKMQNEIKSPKKGVLQKLVAREGSTVNAGDVLAVVE